LSSRSLQIRTAGAHVNTARRGSIRNNSQAEVEKLLQLQPWQTNNWLSRATRYQQLLTSILLWAADGDSYLRLTPTITMKVNDGQFTQQSPDFTNQTEQTVVN
jgi:hypothetical protein